MLWHLALLKRHRDVVAVRLVIELLREGRFATVRKSFSAAAEKLSLEAAWGKRETPMISIP
jgi:hypothetical protein